MDNKRRDRSTDSIGLKQESQKKKSKTVTSSFSGSNIDTSLSSSSSNSNSNNSSILFNESGQEVKFRDVASRVPTRIIERTVPNDILKGLKMIHEAGIKLEAKIQTISTCFSIYHKFFLSIDNASFRKEMVDVQDLIAASCYFIAGKVEEDKKFNLRDILNLFYDMTHPNSELLDVNSTEYFGFRESITSLEALILKNIQFKMKITHAYPYLSGFLDLLILCSHSEEEKKLQFCYTAYRILNDFHFNPSCLNYQCEGKVVYLAIAIIQYTRDLCALNLDEEVDLEEAFTGYTVNSSLINEIMDDIHFTYSWLTK